MLSVIYTPSSFLHLVSLPVVLLVLVTLVVLVAIAIVVVVLAIDRFWWFARCQCEIPESPPLGLLSIFGEMK